jgi:gliding motility-associated-like protein
MKWVLLLILLCTTEFLIGQSVVINEVFAGPSPNPLDLSAQPTTNANSMYSTDQSNQPPYNREYVELYNPNPCDTIDISCFTLGSNATSSTNGDNWGAFTFPAGTKIPPLGFIVIGGNNAPVPLLDFNMTQYRQTSFNVSNLCGVNDRWFLRDQWGWVALYNTLGSPVSAVYWNTFPGNASDLYTEDEYSNSIVNTTACNGTKTHMAAKFIPGIEYVGNINSGSSTSFQREQDGSSVWYASPVALTPRGPNGQPVQPASLSFVTLPAFCGNPTGKITLTIQPGGTGPYSVYWDNASQPGGLVYQNLTAGNHTVKVVDKYNCLITLDTVLVPSAPGPTLSFQPVENEKCTGANGKIGVTVNGGTPPFQYIWNNNPLLTSSTLTGLTAGIYSIKLTDHNNCISFDSVTITNHKEPLITVQLLSPDSCGAGRGEALAVVTGDYSPYSYQWNSNPVQTDSVATHLFAGNYTVTVNDSVCTVTSSIQIPLIPGPTAEFSASPWAVYIEDGVVNFKDLSPGTLVSWNWDFKDGSFSGIRNPIHKFSALGTYQVELTVTDPMGCTGTVTHPVLVKDITSAFFPNAFTPDQDGRNDRFAPVGIYITDFRLLIFDRFGKAIYETTDPVTGWDGNSGNQPVPEGVYVWLATFSFDYGENIIRSLSLNGTVTLLRQK